MFSSAFGQSKPAGGGLFGAPQTNTQQTSGGLFGGLGQNTQQNQNQPQQTSSLFGGLGQSTQQQPQQGGGLFGGAQPQQQTSNLFGGTGQNTQQQQGGGLFGGLGQSTQQAQPQQGGLFGGFGQNQQNQQQQPAASLFGGSTQQNFGQSAQQQNSAQLGMGSLWQPNSEINPREKSVESQVTSALSKWNTTTPDCFFKYYFYNKINEGDQHFYSPGLGEDPKEWEKALADKPGPGYVPVLCTGFAQMGDRIKLQQQLLATFNSYLHQINAALSNMMQDHETKTSIRALDARRRHMVIKQRCLTLAAKVQVLRNRGYALGGDEEDLRSKLIALENNVSDPGLGARGEEIWARMLTVQERANALRREVERSGAEAPSMLNEEMTRRAKKILEDYNTQLGHLKKELETIHQEFSDWQKEQQTPPSRT